MIGIVAWVLGFVSLVAGLSFYYFPDMPTAPNLVTGHTHPINNHGYVTYLNHTQWATHVTLLTLAPVLLVVFGFVVHAQGKLRTREGRE